MGRQEKHMGQMQTQKGMNELAHGNVLQGMKDISQGQAKVQDGKHHIQHGKHMGHGHHHHKGHF